MAISSVKEYQVLEFKDLEDINISNEYITIRRYQDSDFTELNACFDPEFFTWFFVNYANCQEFVAEKLAEYAKKNLVMLVIIDNSTNKVIGTSCLYEISLRHRRLEMGSSWLAKSYQGSAINSMAKYLLIDYLLTKLKFHRIQWKTDALNEKSKMAMAKLGFVPEGTLRRHAITYNGRVRDSLVFAVTDQDWPQVSKIILSRVNQKLSIR